MRRAHTVLVADSDAPQAAALCAYLQGFGLAARAVHDATALRQQLAARPASLLVLDRHLAGGDGLALTSALHRQLPVILTGAASTAIDRVIGLELGADDYLARPFEPRELVARIHTVLRRLAPAEPARPVGAPPMAEAPLRFDGWALDRDQRLLSAPDGREVPLSEAEFRLLLSFLQSAGRVCSRAQLATQARGRTLADCARSIDLLVSRLRHKLRDDPREPRLIKTVRGAGYLFDAAASARPAA